MPSARRLKTFGFILAITIFTILYLTSDSRRAATQDFYTTTVDALNAKDRSDAETSRKLEESRLAAKKGAKPEAAGPAKPVGEPAQAPLEIQIPSRDAGAAHGDGAKVEGKEKGARKKLKGGEKWDMATGREAAMQVGKERDRAKKETPETKEEHEVEVELNAILKKGPIILFSKSYCPFSAKAKRILLEKYTIVPAPYVVELDQHPLGSGLQNALLKSTGRRTVPNILINGKSIGGGDDVEALDVSGTLVEKVRSMGGKRIMEAKLAS